MSFQHVTLESSFYKLDPMVKPTTVRILSSRRVSSQCLDTGIQEFY
ncbi:MULTISPECIES: hypothetical protein [Wolbachia]|nr:MULTISPECIES: hypothetical protein [Wolbachia]